jgi:hypothetical protein
MSQVNVVDCKRLSARSKIPFIHHSIDSFTCSHGETALKSTYSCILLYVYAENMRRTVTSRYRPLRCLSSVSY